MSNIEIVGIIGTISGIFILFVALMMEGISQKTKCKFFWHDWDKWEETLVDVTDVHFGVVMNTTEDVYGQFRHCKECNKKQLRRV